MNEKCELGICGCQYNEDGRCTFHTAEIKIDAVRACIIKYPYLEEE